MKRSFLLAASAIFVTIFGQAAYAAAQEVERQGTTRGIYARYFENFKGGFLSIHAYDPAATASTPLIASWTEGESTRTEALTRVTDSGVYLRHSQTFPVGERPDFVTVERDDENRARIEVEDWPPAAPPLPDGLQRGFHDEYPDALTIADRMEELADDFPELAEVVEMPFETNGYQRKAQVVLGTDSAGTWSTVTTAADRARAIVVTSKAYGQEGGNSIQVALVDPEAPDSPLSVSAVGNSITVNLGTDSSGEVVSTAAQVVAAVNAGPASDLVTASTYSGNEGEGIPLPTSGPIGLKDNLSAPVSVPRGPQKVRILRIGGLRDGSRTGVLVSAGLQGRTRAAQLTAIEFAEELLRNYADVPEIKALVDSLDIFVVPVVNPDGDLYSHYDSQGQRKNMTPHCPVNGQSFPGARNSWGVDINRNFPIGSLFDGYSGGSSNCTAETFSGPAELSEPESKNMKWLAETYTNIKFAANLGSDGGYIAYPPGAYRSAGRVTLPMPPIEHRQLFERTAGRMAARIARNRGNVILPDRVGIKTDATTSSAAGNLDDYLYYEWGIFSQQVNVGIPQHFSGTSWTSVGFAPDFENEGLPSAIEFADGLMGMLETARDWAEDTTPPEVTLTPAPGSYADPVELRFASDEPARIHYTLDGSEPDGDAPVWEPENPHSDVYEPITLTETTTVRWLAIDAKGNTTGPQSATYTIGEAADPDPDPSEGPGPSDEPGSPAPPAPEPPAPAPRLLLGVVADTRCVGDPRLARTKRELAVRLVLTGDAKVRLTLQRRLPGRIRKPDFCPKGRIKPKQPLRFSGRIPVRGARGGTVRRRFAAQLDLKQGTRRIAVLRTLGARRLSPGHYRVRLVAYAPDGKPSGAAALHFRVLGR